MVLVGKGEYASIKTRKFRKSRATRLHAVAGQLPHAALLSARAAASVRVFAVVGREASLPEYLVKVEQALELATSRMLNKIVNNERKVQK